jgi:U3 small nucleolar RNA-associated protein 5
LDDDGNFLPKLSLDKVSHSAVEEGSQVRTRSLSFVISISHTILCIQSIANKRYQESSSLTVGSGFDLDQQDADENSEAQRELDGVLQVDLAELSLGQRLTAVTENNANNASDSENEDGTRDPTRSNKSSKKQSRSENPAIPANSLTRTLIQALHSSDSRLLELCLAHSDPGLISNTVRRLPPQLSIPLITACVERLGRGPRAANMKGRGGGASSQRGAALLVWLKTVLAVHTGHLMTVGPDQYTGKIEIALIACINRFQIWSRGYLVSMPHLLLV